MYTQESGLAPPRVERGSVSPCALARAAIGSLKLLWVSDLPITSAFNDGYVAEQYEAYRRNPDSVDESWRQFFRFAQSLGGGVAAPAGVSAPADGSALRIAAGAAAL